MKRTKEIGYELLRVVNMDGFMELWNKTDIETKDKIVNGIGELAVKLVNGVDASHEQALPIQRVIRRFKSDLKRWIENCDIAEGKMNEIGHNKDAEHYAAQKIAYKEVEDFLTENGL